ncbi:hypothetical protein [Methylotenera sp.]|uniref:hypothetical protein n=1 Tax=Methylotenera sp. TaxID=2051956 RepID=UPI00272F9114|nr:hypothetical protein [Methylotenera sp.]MDP2071565.1 hypothetical protein [Methylotenera sp.]MDP3006656.1 hypothetical protein [Methylotenera sp.]
MKIPTFCASVCPWAIRQSKQHSTWRGIALLGGALGIFSNPEQITLIAGAIGTILGVTDIARNDNND